MLYKMSAEISEQLIELVKHYPYLYNTNEPDFKNVEFKNKIWEEIGGILCEDGKSVKKKFRNLRDCYIKYLRSQAGSSEANTRYKKWQWADQMEYLKPFVSLDQCFKKSKKLGSKTKERDFSEKSQKQKPQQQKPVVNPQRKRNDNPSLNLKSFRSKISTQTEADKVQEPQLTVPNYITCREFDGNEHIFLGYAKTIKKFPPKRQAIIKMQFAKILMEHELEYEQELEEIQRPTEQFYLENTQSEPSNAAVDSPTLTEDTDEKDFILDSD